MGIFRNLLLICSPDHCVKEMRDSYVRIGIPKGAKDEEGAAHGGSACIRSAAAQTTLP